MKDIKLTIHSIVRNELFLYYAIKSVYDYAHKILLYDTGTDNKDCLNIIGRILKEDTANKIIFKKIPIEINETLWTVDNISQLKKEAKGKFGKGAVRQIQLDDTDTEFCMILDGDEVHYDDTMINLTTKILPNLDSQIYCVAIPLIWFYDMHHTFSCYPHTGRIFRTPKVKMIRESPNEAHGIKETEEELLPNTPYYKICGNIKPYAHFETVLKPWRRKHKIKKSQLEEFNDYLPKVMYKNTEYIKQLAPDLRNMNKLKEKMK